MAAGEPERACHGGREGVAEERLGRRGQGSGRRIVSELDLASDELKKASSWILRLAASMTMRRK